MATYSISLDGYPAYVSLDAIEAFERALWSAQEPDLPESHPEPMGHVTTEPAADDAAVPF
jgi:hypothetical protein